MCDDGERDDEHAVYRVTPVGTKFGVVDAKGQIPSLPDGTPATGFDDVTYARQVAGRLNDEIELHEGTPEVTGLFDPYPDEDDVGNKEPDQDQDDWDHEDV